ncbi:hypothetical protein Y1Q_0001919 [Alligator mississippiensis]|uniref:Uncharacterized protein n=1 Tax=Alligator mississippiensis TaxID=8496 RepID=A0A151PGF8_ALLMI|nr:hypothetical protein Y1Q_0001919 [Alligator mississippiensis]
MLYQERKTEYEGQLGQEKSGIKTTLPCARPACTKCARTEARGSYTGLQKEPEAATKASKQPYSGVTCLPLLRKALEKLFSILSFHSWRPVISSSKGVTGAGSVPSVELALKPISDMI